MGIRISADTCGLGRVESEELDQGQAVSIPDEHTEEKSASVTYWE